MFCISAKLAELDRIAALMKYSQVNTYYSSHVNTTQTVNLGLLSEASIKGNKLIYSEKFTVSGVKIDFLSKANKINGSIFEDGLTQYFSSNFIAETWGRPL